MIPPVFTLLVASSDVTAIVGTSPSRIYPAGNVPEVTGGDPNANVPCISWQTIAGHPENYMSGRPDVDNQRIQIDCWALTFTQANALAAAAQAALELSGQCVSLNGHDYEPLTMRYRASFDFSFWVQH